MSYPIGTLMLLEADNKEVRFASRPVQGATNANGTPGQLILDGQQRLTTLYQVLQSSSPVHTRDSRKKPIERWYYFHIPKAIDPTVDREDAIVAVGPGPEEPGPARRHTRPEHAGTRMGCRDAARENLAGHH